MSRWSGEQRAPQACGAACSESVSVAVLPSIRDPRLRRFAGHAAEGRDLDNRPVLSRVIAAPMIAVSIMSLVCLGLLTDLTTQSAAIRRLIDVDLDNAVALSRLDRELSALEIATAAGASTPETARRQIAVIKRALEADSLRDDPALTHLRQDMAELASHPDGAAEVRSLRATVLRRQLAAHRDAQARADAMDAAVRRSTRNAIAGAVLAVLLGAIAASVSLRSLQEEFAAVARIARRLAEATQGARRA